MGPYAVVDYNFTLCRRQSRLQHMYHGHGHWATLCQSRLYPPVWDLGFGPISRFSFNPHPHKVQIYIEYHSVCPLVGIGTLPPPLSPARVFLPPVPKGGGHTRACG
jgi:hypothetical protein